MNIYWRLPSPIRFLIAMIPALILAWMLDNSSMDNPLWYAVAGTIVCSTAWAVLEYQHTRRSRDPRS